jgi:stearoyl-CoA desaturase (delta-9 desaturase)
VPKVLIALVIGFVITQIGVVCTTVFLHRALAHKALTMSRPVRFAFRLVTWMTTGIRPRQWVAVHRKHHAYTDEVGDPHSPLLLGFWKVQLGNVVLYRKAAKDPEITKRYAKDLPADRYDRVLFDHAFLGLGLGIALLVLVFGWQIGLMAAGIHAVLYLAVNSAVNAVGHVYGKKIYENSARNNQWLAWLTAGEGLHNNHHAAPTSARMSLHPREIDPGWWVISALVRTKQATIRLSELKLASPLVGETLAVPGTLAAPSGMAAAPTQPPDEPVEPPSQSVGSVGATR